VAIALSTAVCYILSMKTFTELWTGLDPKQKQRLADKAGTSKAYLSQLAHGHREPSLEMVRSLTAADRRIQARMFL